MSECFLKNQLVENLIRYSLRVSSLLPCVFVKLHYQLEAEQLLRAAGGVFSDAAKLQMDNNYLPNYLTNELF